MFAIGMNSGLVSVRLKLGEEKAKIDRPSAVWSVLFFKNQDSSESIVTADWSRNISFYNSTTGSQIGNSRPINFDPLFVTFLSIAQNDFFLIGGSNCKVQVYTVDGIYLDTLTTQTSWIWACKIHNNRCVSFSLNCFFLSLFLQTFFQIVMFLFQFFERQLDTRTERLQCTNCQAQQFIHFTSNVMPFVIQ